MKPAERALVLSVDGKTQIQAVGGAAPVLTLRTGQPERQTDDDKRSGTLDLFGSLTIKTGKVIGSCKPRRRAAEFRAFLD